MIISAIYNAVSISYGESGSVSRNDTHKYRFSVSHSVYGYVSCSIVGLEYLLKYALIVVSSAPIIALYPFVQKFFMKGVMLGSVKG